MRREGGGNLEISISANDSPKQTMMNSCISPQHHARFLVDNSEIADLENKSTIGTLFVRSNLCRDDKPTSSFFSF